MLHHFHHCAALLCAVALAVFIGCNPAQSPTNAGKPQKTAELLGMLPESCNTPDGMTLMSDESIIVSIPNFNDQKQAPLLAKIGKDNRIKEFFELPKNPDTGRMGPMGIRVAPSGDLYLADNQLFHGKDGKNLFGKSRVTRIVMKDGKPAELIPVATGLNVANGIAIHDGYVYVTETILVPDSKPLLSGVFRFKLDDKNVELKQPLKDDPHLLFTLETQGKTGFGADGICFDGKGNLYVSDFTDAVIYRVVLDKDGKVTEKKPFAKADFMKSCDGMDYDPKTDKIYSADLVGNGVNAIDMQGKVQRLAEDPANDGAGGKLRAPCEALVRGGTIVVANMDFPIPGAVIQKYSQPATISVIKLE
jgi:sugar lactone lactonase YvrE